MKKQILTAASILLVSAALLTTGCKKEDSDTTAPTVSMNSGGTTYVQKDKSFSDPGATATDETDGTLTAVPSGSVNTAVVGTYIITYTATDAAGNKGTAQRTVHVVNFDGNYSLVQSGCTDPGANTTPGSPATSTVNASLTSAGNRIDIGNFGTYSANTAQATFSGTTITVAPMASATGVSGDMIEGTGQISGTGIGTDVLKFTFQFTEKDASGATFNTGTAVFTHN